MSQEKRYCPLCQKRETKSQCSYGDKVWDKVSIKDEEYSMVRSELETIENAVNRLREKVSNGEGNLEAWVQSKITKAADYIDTAADYLSTGESNIKESKNPLKDPGTQIRKSSGAGALTLDAAKQLGSKAVELQKKSASKVSLPSLSVKEKYEMLEDVFGKYEDPNPSVREQNLVDKILSDLKEEDPCWKGYTQIGMKKKNGKEVPNCVPSKGVPKSKGYKKEDVTIEDANGNTFLEITDLIKPKPIKESTRLKSETGNIISVTLSWRGKYYSIKMFFPQSKLPTRKEITYEIQKIYPDSRVIQHSISDVQPGQPLIKISGSYATPGPSKNYVKPMGEQREIEPPRERVGALTDIDIPQSERESARQRTLAKAAANRKKREMKEEVGITEGKKSEMPCNKPKSEAHGSGETGKSHVVKACEGGKEKLIRFGQLGVKGSPKKEGESKKYASRRNRFKSRHAKNIAKGKMSAAFWSNKVKW